MERLTKYPVLSEMGNEYYVTVTEISFGYTSVTIAIRTTGLFGRTKYKTVYGNKIGDVVFDASKWDFDYIEIARSAVKRYEEESRQALREERLKQQGIEEFKRWDGRL